VANVSHLLVVVPELGSCWMEAVELECCLVRGK